MRSNPGCVLGSSQEALSPDKPCFSSFLFLFFFGQIVLIFSFFFSLGPWITISRVIDRIYFHKMKAENRFSSKMIKCGLEYALLEGFLKDDFDILLI